MFYPFNSEDRQRPRDKASSVKGLFRDFFTKPIPIPVCLWNLFVIVVYVQIIIFVVQWGLAAAVAIGLFLRSLF